MRQLVVLAIALVMFGVVGIASAKLKAQPSSGIVRVSTAKHPRHPVRSLPLAERIVEFGSRRLIPLPHVLPVETGERVEKTRSTERFALSHLAWRNSTATRANVGATTGVPEIGTATPGLTSAEAGGYPADVQLAVGPAAVIESANEAIAIFSRSGTSLQRVRSESLGSFFSTTAADRKLDNVGDSRAIYDAWSSRWFILAFDVDRHETVLAVSASGDATGSWSIWTFASNRCPDQPRLAAGTELLIFTDDAFTDCGTSSFVQSELTIINKAALLAGSLGAQDYGFFVSSRYHAATPAQSVSPVGAPYLISVDTRSSSVAHITTPSSPTQSSVPVRDVPLPYSLMDPPRATQPGSTTLDAGDNRVQSAIWDNGTLWFSAAESCVPSGESSVRGCARLAGVSTTTFAITESRDLVLDQQRHILYPALTSDNAGNLEVAFGYSSPSEPAAIGVVSKLANGGGFSSWLTVTPGASAYVEQDQKGRNRWGDYFAAARDPASPATVWIAAEYASGPTSWATTIAAVYAPAATAPVITYSAPSAIGVTSDSASLLANINPQGSGTAYQFEYGLSISYGTNTPPVSLPAISAFQPVAANVGGLAPSTTYHFRAVATNKAGAAAGIDQSFTTAAVIAPTTVATTTTPAPATTKPKPRKAPPKHKTNPKKKAF